MTSPVSDSRLQPLEVIDVVLNSSGSVVCDFCRWLGPIVGSCTGDNHHRIASDTPCAPIGLDLYSAAIRGSIE